MFIKLKTSYILNETISAQELGAFCNLLVDFNRARCNCNSHWFISVCRNRM